MPLGRGQVMENLLMFDYAPDYAGSTVVVTVYKICAKQSGEMQTINISENELLDGMGWHGMAWHDVVCYGMMWYGVLWCSMAWCGMIWCGMA